MSGADRWKAQAVVLAAFAGFVFAISADAQTGADQAKPAAEASSPQPTPAQPAAPKASPADARTAPVAASPPQGAPVSQGCDPACVRANSEFASQICAPRVEAEAPVDFEWVSRPFAKIFQQAEAPSGTATVVRYRGDSIRFLSPQKEWVRVTYECGFDAAKRSVEYVRVRLGRLDKAEGNAQSPPQNTARPAPQQAGPNPGNGAAPPPQKRHRPSEPSEIEIRQVDARSRVARP